MKPREFFPSMPDEVFEIWLQPALERYGWPFSETNTSIDGTDWEEIFGSNISYTVFRNCRWAFTEIDMRKDLLHENSLSTIFKIAMASKTDSKNIEALPCTKEKFLKYLLWSKQHSKIKAPVIAVKDGASYKLVDGHHRLAAYLSVNPAHRESIPCWHPSFKP